jgi:hypothetical protein
MYSDNSINVNNEPEEKRIPMPKYYVNDKAQPYSNDHEVHVETCRFIPQIQSKTDLGHHQNCVTAVAAAKRIYSDSNGCATCSPVCHTT